MMDYVMKKSNRKFIIDNNYCATKIDDVIKINDDFDMNTNATIILQEFIDNPLLIDGKTFDYGIYVTITSFNPLRIYRHKGEVNVRFANYEASIGNKFLCYNPNISASEMPSLSKYINHNYSVERAIANYLSTNGYNVTTLYERMNDAIVSYFMINEQSQVDCPSKKCSHTHQCVQLMRFDFIMDINLNVFIRNVRAFADTNGKIIYNTLKLIGAGNFYENQCRYFLFSM
jgi:hypothetical protein